jgi:UDP-N-acetylmuramoyl-L-alanyl-D-glutamate--2,6-diaminopimelate ligase
LLLSALLADDARLIGDGTVEIRDLATDSRHARPGSLFAALAGTRADGSHFVRDAIARGAVAVLGDERLGTAGLGVPVVVAAEPRRCLAKMAARFHAPQPERVVAVTGTNGKSSIVGFCRQLWTGTGRAGASIGTLGVATSEGERPLALTTPDPVELHACLARLARQGVSDVAIEASSHALAQHRIDGVELAAAAFSNLTRDHFDYHGSFEAYFAAKARLFAELLPPGRTAVLNADVPEFARLAALAGDRGLVVMDYGRAAARLKLLAQEPRPAGQRLKLELEGRRCVVDTPLVGDFQAHNLLAALGLVLATGGSLAELIPLLGSVEGARGRLERVAGHPNGAAIFVDYAHTPDALERVLVAMRAHCPGKLAIVFGAGGDRDPGKRPLMGEAAGRAADRIYVTDDNPRSEEPASIRRAVLEGCPSGIDAGGRREAIRRAMLDLETGDVLIIAGKGHESGQTIGGTTIPFDDAEVVRQLLPDLLGAPA